MIGYTILLALFLVSLYECRICSDTSNLTVMDGEKVVFSVDKSTQKTSAVELHADKCNCKSVESAELTELRTMVANLTMQLEALSTKSQSTGGKRTNLIEHFCCFSVSITVELLLLLLFMFMFIIIHLYVDTRTQTLETKVAALESAPTASHNAKIVSFKNVVVASPVNAACVEGTLLYCINHSTQVGNFGEMLARFRV
jgi:hypothetical protein